MAGRIICINLIINLIFYTLLGCVSESPYIYHNKEFDRSDPDFAKEIKDVLKVAVPEIYSIVKKSNNSSKK